MADNIVESVSKESVSENIVKVRKKPGPKPKSADSKKIDNIDAQVEKSDLKSEEVHEPIADVTLNEVAEPVAEVDNEVKSADDTKKMKVTCDNNAVTQSESYKVSHVLTNCAVYRLPNCNSPICFRLSKGCQIFFKHISTEGFLEIRYNSFEKGSSVGYVQSRYVSK